MFVLLYTVCREENKTNNNNKTVALSLWLVCCCLFPTCCFHRPFADVKHRVYLHPQIHFKPPRVVGFAVVVFLGDRFLVPCFYINRIVLEYVLQWEKQCHTKEYTQRYCYYQCVWDSVCSPAMKCMNKSSVSQGTLSPLAVLIRLLSLS